MKIKVTMTYPIHEFSVDTEDPNFKIFCKDRDMRFRHEKKKTIEDLAIEYEQRFWDWTHGDEHMGSHIFDWEAEKELYTVRLYDGFDNKWMDISKEISYEEAKKIWDEKTKNGTANTDFEDRDYYSIFPANTRMLRR